MAGRFAHLELDPAAGRPAGPPVQRGAAEVTAADLLARAEQQELDGDFEHALRLFTRCLEQDRSAVAAWVGQVRMLVELDELREASLWVDKALELFRNQGELLAVKAQAQLRLGDRPMALATSDRALKAPGSSAWRWLVRAGVLFAQSQRAAKTCLQRALEQEHAELSDRVRAVRLLLHEGQAGLALEQIRRVLGDHPAVGPFWYLLGRCQQELGWPEDATTSYQRCLELQRDHRQALAALSALQDAPWAARVLRRVRQWLRHR